MQDKVGPRVRPRVRLVRVAAVGAVALGLVLISACSGGKPLGIGKKDEPAAATIAVTPQDGAQKVQPEKPIEVAAKGGTLQSVTVEGKGGKQIEGEMSADKTQWRTKWPVAPNAQYKVTASAVNPAGKGTQVTSSFTTLKPARTFGIADITPDSKEVVGVGMPVMINFDTAVPNRAEVEKALELQMSQPVEGAWHWFSDTSVQFRTKEYWPKGTKVKLVAHLTGTRGAKNTYGVRDVVREFTVGRSQISTVNTKTHHMTVVRDGKLVRKIPISAGNGAKYKYITTNGKHLAMQKEYHTVMDSSTLGCPKGCPDYYRLDVYYTVKFSDSGEYVHGAPWSTGSQGNSNVSHGCVNASTSNARWFMETTLRGDPINVTGTRRPLEHMNGWAQWEIPWNKWVAGSALKSSINSPAETGATPGATPGTTPVGTPPATSTPATTPTAAGAPQNAAPR